MTPFDQLDRAGGGRLMFLAAPECGLQAVLAIDSTVLGPAAGGIRTRPYPCWEDAVADALQLARAMTLKCALTGLDAGGGKLVVLDSPRLDRQAAFEKIGRWIEDLGGLLRTAGDLGTGDADLAAVARHCRWVHLDGGHLADAVARGLEKALEAVARHLELPSLKGVRALVPGCGAIGNAVALRLAAAGAQLVVADTQPERAEAVAARSGAQIEAPDRILSCAADILVPCAGGGFLTEATVADLRVRAICGAANNQLASPGIADHLARAGILFVPDELASAGAVVAGISRTVMAVPDPLRLVDRIGDITDQVLRQAAESGRTPRRVAVDLALQRLKETGPHPAVDGC